jgi:hypothetical protein
MPSHRNSSYPLNLGNLKSRLVHGLAGWLAFEFRCERGHLFSEYYLAQPIGQLLRESQRQGLPGGLPKVSVRAEVDHPVLTVESVPGRRPAIDFVVYSAGSSWEDDVVEPLLAVETKWAGYSKVTTKALIWDAFRLAAYHAKTGVPGLLVLAGKRDVLADVLRGASFLSKKGKPMLCLASGQGLPAVTGHKTLRRRDLPAAVADHVDTMERSPGRVPDGFSSETPAAAHGPGSASIAFDVHAWVIRS